MSSFDFGDMHAAMQRYIDEGFLSCISTVVLEGSEVVDRRDWGFMDLETREPLRTDAIYRLYSNTKIVTAIAAMMLYERGSFSLDDPLEKHLPELSGVKVLKEGATSVEDVEPAATLPTVRQAFCHNAGFSYGFLQESVVDGLYNERGMLNPSTTLAEKVAMLGQMPLAYQPGKRWQYSVSSDVLARLVEVWSQTRFSDFLKARIFDPLEMHDTGFFVPAGQEDRLALMYRPANPLDPTVPGLERADDAFGRNYLALEPFESGGGGLVGTIGDYTKLIRMIMNGGELDGIRILERETLEMMHTNQLPAGVGVQIVAWNLENTVFGLGFAIKTAPAGGEPDAAIDEYHWGGMAGTHSWMSPRANIAGLAFTQRMPGFWHAFSHDFKRLVYRAMV
jgi:CubicO group peptidase (beta-lactamase class C family)